MVSLRCTGTSFHMKHLGARSHTVLQGDHLKDIAGNLARRARIKHLFGPVPHQWPIRGCTKGAHLAQCSYLGV